MKTKHEKIEAIALALDAYNNMSQPPEIVTSTLEGIDDIGIATLYGMTGLFCHAASEHMPGKWLKFIHDDLVEAFCFYANHAHTERISAPPTPGATASQS